MILTHRHVPTISLKSIQPSSGFLLKKNRKRNTEGEVLTVCQLDWILTRGPNIGFICTRILRGSGACLSPFVRDSVEALHSNRVIAWKSNVFLSLVRIEAQDGMEWHAYRSQMNLWYIFVFDREGSKGLEGSRVYGFSFT